MENRVVNIFSGIVAVFLSILLVAVSVAAPLYLSLKSFTKPEKMTNLIREIDYVGIVADDPTVEKLISKFKISEDDVDVIIKSEAAGEFITLYIDDVTRVLTGKQDKISITADTLTGLVDKHMDDFIAVAHKNSRLKLLPEEVIEKRIKKVVNDNADNIVKALPDADEINSMVSGQKTQTVIKTVANLNITLILIAAIVILSFMVFAARYKRFSGLIWIGTDFAVAGILLIVISFLIRGKTFTGFVSGLVKINKTVTDSVFSVYSKGITVGFIVFLSLAVLFLAAGILLRIKTKKPPQTPAQLDGEVTDEIEPIADAEPETAV